jgi:hypothetical protein
MDSQRCCVYSPGVFIWWQRLHLVSKMILPAAIDPGLFSGKDGLLDLGGGGNSVLELISGTAFLWHAEHAR